MSVTEETPYLSGFLATVTVMTLMTVIYGLILDEGKRRYFLGPYPFNLTRRTRRWEQKILFLCCSRAYNLCRVFSDWLITRRRHPTTDRPCRRVGEEHRRV
jgi:hypothetical protein